MPASGSEPIASALRVGFAAGSKMSIDNGLETSAKRVLQTHIGFEPATSFQATVLGTLKSKYIVINTKEKSVNNGKANGVNGVNVVHKKVLGAQLPVPKTTLYPQERIQLGFRGGLSVGSGMINLGNTCYLNSTLQALFHVPAFVNWLLSDPAHLKCEQNSDYHMHPDDITCAVIKTFKCSQQKTGSAMKPLCIYSKLKAICKHLSQGSQEDAHEFMRYLLESLEKAFLKVQGHNLDSWSKETTPINQIFGGYIRSEVTCLSCRAVSTTFQHFQDLPLDIRKASTLDDALAGYFELERLPEGEDAYKCDKCGRKVAATKKFSVERPPNVLCIQLKRFNMMNGKLTKQVQLPQSLDLKRFISRSVQPGHPVRYRFVSMVTHIGQSVNCGHYTAIALAANGSYYQFDDGCVRQISVGNVMNMVAYLALYELERPFSPHNSRPAPTTPAGAHADKESESASVGGSEAKKPRTSGSPTAGSPAPRTSPAPAGGSASGTSLVPYDSDADSETEDRNKDSEGTSSGWKITPVDKPRADASPLPKGTNSWRVTDVTPPIRRLDIPGSAATPAASGGEARTPIVARREIPDLNLNSKRRDVVAELTQNSHRGYGFNKVRTWNGHTTEMDRQLDIERRENRKRTYDDDYNADFDRGKTKKKRYDHGRDKGQDRYNPFQLRANEQNSWQRHKNNGMRYGSGSRGFRRNNNHNNNNRHHNNYYSNSYYHRNSCYQ